MISLTINNFPEELYARLEAAAAQHRCSINSEVIGLLDQALWNRPGDAESWLSSARRLRTKTAGNPITDDELNEAKVSGRE